MLDTFFLLQFTNPNDTVIVAQKVEFPPEFKPFDIALSRLDLFPRELI